MRDQTSIHFETGGRYPELEALLAPVLSGEKLKAVVNGLNELTRLNSVRIHGSGDPSIYNQIERDTEAAFKEVGSYVPRDYCIRFNSTVIQLAQKTHAFSWNPFLAALAHTSSAAVGYREIESDRESIRREKVLYDTGIEVLSDVSRRLKSIQYEALLSAVSDFTGLEGQSFRQSSLFRAADHCVRAIACLTDIPQTGEGGSWPEQGLPFWRNLRFYAPMSKSKILASAQLTKLVQLVEA